MVRQAHQNMLPDDWRFYMVVRTLRDIVVGDTPDSDGRRLAAADQALALDDYDSITAACAAAQADEMQEVFHVVYSFLSTLEEEDEDE